MQTCDDCGARIWVARRDARYCSNACRQRAYRERRSVPRLSHEEAARIVADLEEMFARGPGHDVVDTVTDKSRNAEEIKIRNAGRA